MNPVGKYFKTEYSIYYCYEVNTVFIPQGYTCVCVQDGRITTDYLLDPTCLPESTREDFMAAYARTIEAIDAIVEGGT